ncbi:MAG: glycosyltransferase, partial [Dehalococcoidia bacterium]|nr:glycosyltransferase [Dehalococcoidia bacterium]
MSRPLRIGPRCEAFSRTRVVEIDVAQPTAERHDLAGYGQALVLLRVHGRPVGFLRVPCLYGRLRALDVQAALETDADLADRVQQALVRHWLLQQHPASRAPQPLPHWSVIICTRGRPEDLTRCLDSLMAARHEGGEIIVVDNDPPDDATRQVAARYPVKYVREPRRGLNWARSGGARAAAGEILIYTDDDVVVDRDWIPSILVPFAASRVGAVTGLTMPYEMESEPQELFERYGGHRRGFDRKVFDNSVIPPAAAGLVGSGANMALRRDVVRDLRVFESELDVGTAALSGGDAYAYYLVLARGYQIVYTPEALVWHKHRRDRASLRKMLYAYGVGAFAFLTRAFL